MPPNCTCNHTAEEMEAASSPWHRKGCPAADSKSDLSSMVAPGDRFQQVLPYGRDMLEVESWIDGERVAVRRRSGGRQVFPVSTLLNPTWWVRIPVETDERQADA